MSESLFQSANLALSSPVISISELNRIARERLESAFPLCWICGEVSNIVHASSGHVYFSLKDANAQVRCVMFRNCAQLLGWRLQNGQHIEARVLVTLYEARGDFQLNVETARKAGVGNLYEQFLLLKDKLQREGLFAAENKRPLPSYPSQIGIVTSLQAAALRDVLTTLRRRAPQVAIILYPTPVQGEGAAAQIADAVRSASARRECDILILCRGGGSLEDLWAFNDETLARAIRASAIPVISGIGHETDFTIADFVADQRAPTPTAAAELAAPEQAALQSRLDQLGALRDRWWRQTTEQRYQLLDTLSLRLQPPAQRFAQKRGELLNLRRRMDSGLRQSAMLGRHRLADLTQRLLLARPDTGRLAQRLGALVPRLHGEWQRKLSDKSAQLAQIAVSLDHLNPHAVLARGYSIVTDETGNILRDTLSLKPSDRITVTFHSGHAQATVTTVSKPTKNNG